MRPELGNRRKIRAALVGLGRIGWMLEKDPLRYHPCTHAGTMRALGVQIRAGCDIRSERREGFARWMAASVPVEGVPEKGPLLFESASALAKTIREGELSVDLAVVGTGADSHPYIFRELLLAGVPNFLIEKPVALNVTEARKMERLARQKHARVYVNFERRYHPAYRLIKKVIEDERYGSLRHIEGRVLSPSGARDPLLEDGIHWIDLLLWYAGEPKRVNSRYHLDRAGREKSSLHIFDYDTFEAVFESGGERKYFEFFMRLDFERGRIIAGNDGHFHFESGPSKKYAGFRELSPKPVQYARQNPWMQMYREIAAGRDCSSPLSEAVRGLKWIDRCREFK